MRMAQAQPSVDAAKQPELPQQFVDMGKKQLQALADMQRQFWETAGKISQTWLDQSQSEAALLAELSSKIAAARSVPDAAAVYQEFASRQLQLFAESGRRMFKDGEGLIGAGGRSLAARGGGFSS
jgi:hypothetical protein